MNGFGGYPLSITHSRHRTFPLTRSLSVVSHVSHLSLHPILSSLDFLYSGPQHIVHLRNDRNHSFDGSPRSSCMSPTRQIVRELQEVEEALGHTVFEYSPQNKKRVPEINVDRSDWELWAELYVLPSAVEHNLLRKGDFVPIQASRLDFPCYRPRFASSWVEKMPESTSHIFSDPSRATLIAHVLESLQRQNFEIPTAKVYAQPGQFERALSLATDAGMISWSDPRTEAHAYQTIADALAMTSFAVNRNSDRDRLIGWPRVQNELMPPPPHTDLPNTCAFENIRLQEGVSLSGF